MHSVRWFALLAVVQGLVACHPQPSVYVPTAPAAPLLKKAGEVRISGAFNNDNNRSGYNATFGSVELAYALNDDLALMINGAFDPMGHDSNTRSFRYGEVALGYYEPFKEYGRMEVWAGAGTGHVQSNCLDTLADLTIFGPPTDH